MNYALNFVSLPPVSDIQFSEMMEQIERIKTMEQHLDRASQAVMRLSAALEDYSEAQEALHKLEAYYGSDDWKQDFAADEQGRLPRDLRRGVLSEDGIWNLLEDNRTLNTRIKEIINNDHEPLEDNDDAAPDAGDSDDEQC